MEQEITINHVIKVLKAVDMAMRHGKSKVVFAKNELYIHNNGFGLCKCQMETIEKEVKKCQKTSTKK